MINDTDSSQNVDKFSDFVNIPEDTSHIPDTTAVGSPEANLGDVVGSTTAGLWDQTLLGRISRKMFIEDPIQHANNLATTPGLLNNGNVLPYETPDAYQSRFGNLNGYHEKTAAQFNDAYHSLYEHDSNVANGQMLTENTDNPFYKTAQTAIAFGVTIPDFVATQVIGEGLLAGANDLRIAAAGVNAPSELVNILNEHKMSGMPLNLNKGAMDMVKDLKIGYTPPSAITKMLGSGLSMAGVSVPMDLAQSALNVSEGKEPLTLEQHIQSAAQGFMLGAMFDGAHSAFDAYSEHWVARRAGARAAAVSAVSGTPEADIISKDPTITTNEKLVEQKIASDDAKMSTKKAVSGEPLKTQDVHNINDYATLHDAETGDLDKQGIDTTSRKQASDAISQKILDAQADKVSEGMTEAQALHAQMAEQVFGVKTKVYDRFDSEGKPIEPIKSAYSAGNTIYIPRDMAKEQLPMVTGHEIYHTLPEDVKAEVDKVIADTLTEDQKQRNEAETGRRQSAIWNTKSPEGKADEINADIFAKNIYKKEFQDRLAAGDQGIFQRVMGYIKTVANKLRSWAEGRPGAEEYATLADKLGAIIAKAKADGKFGGELPDVKGSVKESPPVMSPEDLVDRRHDGVVDRMPLNVAEGDTKDERKVNTMKGGVLAWGGWLQNAADMVKKNALIPVTKGLARIGGAFGNEVSKFVGSTANPLDRDVGQMAEYEKQAKQAADTRAQLTKTTSPEGIKESFKASFQKADNPEAEVKLGGFEKKYQGTIGRIIGDSRSSAGYVKQILQDPSLIQSDSGEFADAVRAQIPELKNAKTSDLLQLKKDAFDVYNFHGGNSDKFYEDRACEDLKEFQANTKGERTAKGLAAADPKDLQDLATALEGHRGNERNANKVGAGNNIFTESKALRNELITPFINGVRVNGLVKDLVENKPNPDGTPNNTEKLVREIKGDDMKDPQIKSLAKTYQDSQENGRLYANDAGYKVQYKEGQLPNNYNKPNIQGLFAKMGKDRFYNFLDGCIDWDKTNYNYGDIQDHKNVMDQLMDDIKSGKLRDANDLGESLYNRVPGSISAHQKVEFTPKGYYDFFSKTSSAGVFNDLVWNLEKRSQGIAVARTFGPAAEANLESGAKAAGVDINSLRYQEMRSALYAAMGEFGAVDSNAHAMGQLIRIPSKIIVQDIPKAVGYAAGDFHLSNLVAQSMGANNQEFGGILEYLKAVKGLAPNSPEALRLNALHDNGLDWQQAVQSTLRSGNSDRLLSALGQLSTATRGAVGSDACEALLNRAFTLQTSKHLADIAEQTFPMNEQTMKWLDRYALTPRDLIRVRHCVGEGTYANGKTYRSLDASLVPDRVLRTKLMNALEDSRNTAVPQATPLSQVKATFGAPPGTPSGEINATLNMFGRYASVTTNQNMNFGRFAFGDDLLAKGIYGKGALPVAQYIANTMATGLLVYQIEQMANGRMNNMPTDAKGWSNMLLRSATYTNLPYISPLLEGAITGEPQRLLGPFPEKLRDVGKAALQGNGGLVMARVPGLLPGGPVRTGSVILNGAIMNYCMKNSLQNINKTLRARGQHVLQF